MVLSKRPLLKELTGDDEIEALLSDDAQLSAMLEVERALAAAEADAGLISSTAAAAIADGIARFTPDWDELTAGMARDGVVVPALVRQLRDAIGEPHAMAVHRGATSQDIIDTALVVGLARIIPILLTRIDRLERTLQELSERFGGRSLMAYTRMQPALEFTVADKMRTWTEPLARHGRALATMRTELLVVQLGGPIGDRSSFNGRGEEVARSLARHLDLAPAPSWHSTRDPLIAFGSRLAMLTGSLGKVGADVGLLAFNKSVEIAGGGRSSAMSHKRNPVYAELLVALAHYTAGLAGTLHHAMVHENERSGAAWTLEWLTLPPLIAATGAALRSAQNLIDEVRFENPLS
jgi:3-carboxy-cis,cis-muconate cycloisomerase